VFSRANVFSPPEKPGHKIVFFVYINEILRGKVASPINYFYIKGFCIIIRELKPPRNLMLDGTSNQISLLLIESSKGDELALEQLMPLVYKELHRMAQRYMRRQPPGHTFQTTELIHEAYLKIARSEEQNWQNRAHFFAVAAQAMRHILVDYARSKQSQKQGGWHERITLAENSALLVNKTRELVALDDALNSLANLDKRKCQVVELKYFGGLTTEEIAEVLKLSPDTVKRDWKFARNWLLRELAQKE
jgi:RNA polymerase sigma factor (TIGR02999 family)